MQIVETWATNNKYASFEFIKIPTSVTMSILSIKFQSWKISAAAANAGKMKTLDSPSLIIKKKLIDYPNVDCR